MTIPHTIEDLTEEQLVLLPTEDDVKFYEQHGWYASKVILPDELLDNAVEGANKYYAGERDFEFRFADSDGIANDAADTASALRNNEFVTLQKKELQDVGYHPLISAIAAKLERVDEIRLFADSLICKFPVKPTNKGVVGWHTDKAYWPTCSSEKLLTAWIPFQDCTPDMGALMHVDESHLWKDETELKSFFSIGNQNLDGLEEFLAKTKPAYHKSLMLLKKGQVSFHNCNTIHCSSPNTSDRTRLALIIHMQDGDNDYQEAYQENGKKIVIGYDRMCRKKPDGNPDYRDEYLFPLLWHKANTSSETGDLKT